MISDDEHIADVARNMQLIWVAFKKIESTLVKEPGVFGDACLTAVASESLEDHEFDTVQFTRLVCNIREQCRSSYKCTQTYE